MTEPASESTSIAIIGMAGRFPGAADCDRFWKNLEAGAEAISFFSRDELREAGVPEELISDPDYVPARGSISGEWQFDAGFFGYSPREAQKMDPQHRIFLECAWHAMESAGYATPSSNRRVGVWGGAGFGAYHTRMFARGQSQGGADDVDLMLGSEKGFLTTRVSYKLGLRGPSLDVQTACSTSLVAVTMACQSLLTYQCDLGLAGGVSVVVPQATGYPYQPEMIYSPDGHCRAFDVRANGCVPGNGVGVVTLKRLDDALADRDEVLAVIRGFAVNNDGSQKIGFTAPSSIGQSEVILEALGMAGLTPDDISYIEAHGTGTPLGDPIEIEGLKLAFASARGRHFCGIGSVKTNVGHLDAAAGVAGLIKTVLSLRHRMLPPSLNFNEPNPKLGLDDSPFFINSSLREWKNGDAPLRAGVSSFGLGGTNAHLVVEEAPARTPSDPDREWRLLPLSARNEPALDRQADALAQFLERQPECDLTDVAYTLQTGRRRFETRRVVVARSREESIARLRTPGMHQPKRAEGRSTAFLFPGGGAQYAGMGLGLYRSEAVFREAVDACSRILCDRDGIDLSPFFNGSAAASSSLSRPDPGLPALFVVEYGLAQLLASWGIRPAAMLGHSLGEYTAACLAGTLSLEDALSLVALRGLLFCTLPPGSMLSVTMPEEKVAQYLSGTLAVAAVNGPESCVVSGAVGEIETLRSALEESGIEVHRLAIDVASHGPVVAPILDQFAAGLARCSLRPPKIPYLSNVTGTWITPEQATSMDYWIDHLKQTVRFADGLRELLQDSSHILLEVGPGHSLTGLARLQCGQAVDVIPMMRHSQDPQPDEERLLQSLGRLWSAGADISWDGFHEGRRRNRLLLPTYPFEREEHQSDIAAPPLPAQEGMGRRLPLDRWFYLPFWKPSLLSASTNPQPSNWLVFDTVGSLAPSIQASLGENGTVARAVAGDSFSRIGPFTYQLRPECGDDYRRMLEELAAEGWVPSHLVHAFALAGSGQAIETAAGLRLGYYSVLHAIRSVRRVSDQPVRMAVLCRGAFDPLAGEAVEPVWSAMLGPVLVAPQEFENVRCMMLDIGTADEPIAKTVIAELSRELNEPVAAYRRGRRYLADFEPVTLPAECVDACALRRHGVYLITGAFGQVGRLLTEYLIKEWQARLILVGRTPPQEHAGEGMLVAAADCADAAAMRRVVSQAEERFGAIDGLFHAAAVTDLSAVHRPLEEMRDEESELQFHAKIYGLQVLSEVFSNHNLDFALVFSSNASILGGLGLTAYTAANAFMNAFASRRASESHRVMWRSVTWDGWPRLTPSEAGRLGIDAYRMERDESLQALGRVLSVSDVPWLAVSAGNLRARRDFWVRRLTAASAKPSASAPAERRELTRPYEAPRNGTESAVSDMLADLLGVRRVGIHDNFFELGGHSLLATRLLGRVRRQFSANVTLRRFFTEPTVAGLATAIVEVRAAQADPGVLERLLAGLENNG